MTLKCIAIDDEPLALELIEKYSKEIPFLELVGTYTNPLEGLKKIQELEIDLLLLDIRMPDISGFQLLNALRKKPMVILITAYNQYGPESYEFEVVDYLLKPIPIDKFIKSIGKAKELYDHKINRKAEPELKADDSYIFVNAEYKLIKIKIHDILYIEGLKDYIKIHVQNTDKPVLTLMSIKTFEEKLPPTGFLRIHRSYMINTQKIDFIKKGRVYIGEHEIPVGESYSEMFAQWLENKNWK